MKENRPTLVLAVSSLDLLVFTLLDLSFEYSSALRFIEASDFEYLRRVEPRI